MQPNILIVDDDKLLGLSLKKLFQNNDFDVRCVTNGKAAINEVEQNPPQVVLLDFQLPDLNGFEILQKIKQIDSSIIVILITSFGEVRKAVTALKLGAYDFYSKPFEQQEILSAVKQALQSQCNCNQLSQNWHSRMGNSEPLQNMLHLVQKVAQSDISVFLEGETGTGKELISRMIHENSNRKNNAFVTVDCGAIPENLFESELFGHKKGAFTGALFDKKGKFELANNGTLFLDEINSLPIHLQPKFLRALQEKEIQRLGDEKPVRIDVRIISAANRSISESIQSGQFREDLFYRIHEFKISLPTLQERKIDIPVIATYFLAEISRQYHKQIDGFSNEAMEKLLDYSWPGNIRELKNVLKCATLLAESGKIEAEHLVFNSIQPEKNSEFDSTEMMLDKVTTKTEIVLIRKALRAVDYNKAEAAKLLGISRSQLYKKLEKLNIL
jgi:DNA-binding NtrC family response regulator